ncbi:DUF7389 domain-containing protein [Halosegnis longus]|uniref:DUF7389 domain-containing protein n=1 Tax=Halosegnis longus TaxID=2216012 RepID=UPI00129E461C|nr:hypothetical protein [Halosegnis longus]
MSDNTDELDEFEFEITRGTGTRDQDTIGGTVRGESLEEAGEKLDDAMGKMQSKARELRSIQPEAFDGFHFVDVYGDAVYMVQADEPEAAVPTARKRLDIDDDTSVVYVGSLGDAVYDAKDDLVARVES